MNGLQGTMATPPNPLEEVLRQMAALSQAPNPDVAAANQQAAQAQAAYGSAAAQPPPTLDPASTFVPTLFNNIASVISGNQSYQQNAQDELKQKKSDLLKARADNLLALRDTYSQQAERAQKLGDLDTEMKARAKLETLSKTSEQLLQTQRLDAHAAEERERSRQKGLDRQSAERIAANKVKPGTDPDEIEAYANDAVNGTLLPPQIPKEIRGKVLKLIQDRGQTMMPQTARKAIGEVGSALEVVNQLSGLSEQIHTEDGLLGSAVQAGKIGISKLRQDPVVNTYFDARKSFAATLARAAGERGALTKQDVTFALSLIPGEVAGKKRAAMNFEILNDFLTRRQEQAVRTYTTAGGGLTPKSPNSVAKDEALRYATSGDIEKVKALIEANPLLNNDAELRKAMGL